MPDTARSLVLIVEDDERTAALVGLYLEQEGLAAVAMHSGTGVVDYVRSRRPDFVILDLMLPDVDGWTLCRRLREVSDVPILFLTAREEEMDRVLGLSLGADDYVVKPFSPRELVARVKAIMRRTRGRGAPLASTLVHGDLELNVETHTVRVAGRPIALTPSEFTLLQTLMASPGRVFSRGELLDRLYPAGAVVVDRVIDVHIGKLRQKVEQSPGRPERVLTVRGVGYRFTDEAA